mmetsp:Transcript_10355/g.14257  ORF Transcript_10355/g.14257 Transcript_10355/m.14257 type:complete len:826 (+) Transcript_10355:1774-4251(+)
MQSAFMQLIQPTLRIGLLNDIAIAPIVYPNVTEASFEAYAYRLFKRDKGYPPGYGNSSIGFGIYAQDPRTKKYYHDTTGKTNFSTYDILIPNFECSTCLEMFNLHSDLSRAVALDYLIESFALGYRNYSAVTGFTTINTSPNETTASVMFFPIAPSQNLTLLVGFIKVSQSWREVLAKSMPVGVKGVDIVVSDSHSEISFTAHGDTSVLFTGIGNLHDSQYKSFARTFPTFYNPGYGDYSISFYPNRSFFPANTNVLPIVACIGVIIFLLLIEILFGAYGHYLERQLQQKQEALDSKRSFVRFISHEIRTPLNTVCMGLKVLQEEAEKALADSISRPITPTAIQRLSEVASSSQKRRGQIIENACDSYVKSLKDSVAGWVALMRDIEESSNNAVNVLNELMSYDKIEMKTLQLEVALLPVWSLVANSIKPFYIQARERGLHMQLLMEIDSNEDGSFTTEAHRSELQDLHVVGDEVRLAQVFRNLISNALKFSYPGTTVTVQVRYCPERLRNEGDEFIHSSTISTAINLDSVEVAGSIVVSVQDHGPGLTADNLNKLFREGVQFNANKLQGGGGSGLGLWIAKGIVNLHGGIISATSEGQGTGATFTVELPVVRALSADARSKQNSHSQNNDHGSLLLGGDSLSLQDPFDRIVVRNVLVVDDAPLNRKMLCRLLTNIGCKCMEFCNGYECVEMMRNKLQRSQSASNSKKLTLMNVDNEFSEMDEQIHSKGSNHNNIEDFYDDDTAIDLILMDFEMPVKKGPEACAELRAMGVDCLIVGVTGNVLQADIDYYVSMGAQSVVAKPFSLVKLMETLKRFHCVSLGKKIL